MRKKILAGLLVAFIGLQEIGAYVAGEELHDGIEEDMLETGDDESTNFSYEIGVNGTEISVVKVIIADISDGEVLEGAVIRILDNWGNTVDEWISSTEAHIIEGLETGKEYTIHEKTAPEGYIISPETTFMIDDTGRVTTTGDVSENGVLLVKNRKTQVKIIITDITNGKALEGATIQILDDYGNVVEEWTSSLEAHIIEGLDTGKRYTIHEEAASEGYILSPETTFIIDETGKVTTTGEVDENGVLLVNNMKTQVKVITVDSSDGETLEGAMIRILDDYGNVIDEWTSSAEVHIIEGLDTGKEYTICEETAPAGYIISPETTFMIGVTGKVTTTSVVDEDGVLLVENMRTRVKVLTVDISDGKALEGAMIRILDDYGNVVDEWTSSAEAHIIEGLDIGKEYTIRDVSVPAGYIIMPDTAFTIDEIGKVTTTGPLTEDGTLLIEGEPLVNRTPNLKLIACYNGAKGVGTKWVKMDDVVEYYIWQKYNGAWEQIDTVKPDDKSLIDEGRTLMYTDTTVSANYGKGYIYTVTALKHGYLPGEIPDSTKFTGVSAGVAIYRLSPPTLKRITNLSSGTVTVTWKGVFSRTESNGAYDLQYAEYRDGKTGTFMSVKPLPGFDNLSHSATISGLEKGTRYVFRIRCSKTNKDRGTYYSEYSPWLSITIEN